MDESFAVSHSFSALADWDCLSDDSRLDATICQSTPTQLQMIAINTLKGLHQNNPTASSLVDTLLSLGLIVERLIEIGGGPCLSPKYADTSISDVDGEAFSIAMRDGGVTSCDIDRAIVEGVDPALAELILFDCLTLLASDSTQVPLLDILAFLEVIVNAFSPQRLLSIVISHVRQSLRSERMRCHLSAIILLAATASADTKVKGLVTYANRVWPQMETLVGPRPSILSFAFLHLVSSWIDRLEFCDIIREQSDFVILLILRWLDDPSHMLFSKLSVPKELVGIPSNHVLLGHLPKILDFQGKKIIPHLGSLTSSLLDLICKSDFQLQTSALAAICVVAAHSGSMFAPHLPKIMGNLNRMLTLPDKDSPCRGKVCCTILVIYDQVGKLAFQPYLVDVIGSVLYASVLDLSPQILPILGLLGEVDSSTLKYLYPGDAMSMLVKSIIPILATCLLHPDNDLICSLPVQFKFTFHHKLALLAILFDAADAQHFADVIDDLYLAFLPLSFRSVAFHPANLTLVILYIIDEIMEASQTSGPRIRGIRRHVKNRIKTFNSGGYMSSPEITKYLLSNQTLPNISWIVDHSQVTRQDKSTLCSVLLRLVRPDLFQKDLTGLKVNDERSPSFFEMIHCPDDFSFFI